MPKSHNQFVNQKRLAKELGVTDRRVRQMVAEFILPEPRPADDLYDLDLCHDRYDLYKDGSDGEWDRFSEDLVNATKATEALVAIAFADGASTEDVTRASLAAHADFAAFKFLNACQSKSRSEADLWHMITDREYKLLIGGLLHRALEIMGASGMVDDDGKVIFAMPIYPDLESLNAGRR